MPVHHATVSGLRTGVSIRPWSIECTGILHVQNSRRALWTCKQLRGLSWMLQACFGPAPARALVSAARKADSCALAAAMRPVVSSALDGDRNSGAAGAARGSAACAGRWCAPASASALRCAGVSIGYLGLGIMCNPKISIDCWRHRVNSAHVCVQAHDYGVEMSLGTPPALGAAADTHADAGRNCWRMLSLVATTRPQQAVVLGGATRWCFYGVRARRCACVRAQGLALGSAVLVGIGVLSK